ncbi:MAG: methyltransferase domain-containing protein [Planctomycetota bacterium]|nr:methyltransferase domain-containing protein [Planctomycetota bacterium]
MAPLPRSMTPELMDDPNLDPAAHAAALAGLARLNRLSRSVEVVWAPMREWARRRGLDRLRVLDVATGSGDVPIALAARAAREGIALAIDACDMSEQALAIARGKAKRARVELNAFRLDVVRQPIPALPDGKPGNPGEPYDVVLSSLFLHHLTREQAVGVVGHMGRAGRLVLVNDLERRWRNLVLVGASALLLTRSRVVHVDSRLSVRAAWTCGEMRAIFEEAGLAGARVGRRALCRLLAMWERPE